MLVVLAMCISPLSATDSGFPSPSPVEFVDDITYGNAAGTPLVMEMAKPKSPDKSPRPAVVFIHGGGWSSADRTNGTPLIRLLAQNGFVAVSIDYRLSGSAGFPAQLEDAKCAVRFLRAHAAEFGIDPDRIGVMGGSAGGHLAALVGLTPEEKDLEGSAGWADFSSKVSAVADLYGISDLPGLIRVKKLNPAVNQLMRCTLEENPGLYRSASPLSWVRPGAPSFYITHGDKDATVPLEQSERLAEALRAAGVDVMFRVMPGSGHGSVSTLPDYVLKDIVDFFRKALGSVEKLK